jgi:hypothetical protein
LVDKIKVSTIKKNAFFVCLGLATEYIFSKIFIVKQIVLFTITYLFSLDMPSIIIPLSHKNNYYPSIIMSIKMKKKQKCLIIFFFYKVVQRQNQSISFSSLFQLNFTTSCKMFEASPFSLFSDEAWFPLSFFLNNFSRNPLKTILIYSVSICVVSSFAKMIPTCPLRLRRKFPLCPGHIIRVNPGILLRRVNPLETGHWPASISRVR